MDVRLTMVPEDLDKAAGKADEIAGTLTGSLAGALTAMHVAASLNVAQSSQTLLQYAAQISAALRQLVEETQTQAGLLRKSKEKTVQADMNAAADQRQLGLTIDT